MLSFSLLMFVCPDSSCSVYPGLQQIYRPGGQESNMCYIFEWDSRIPNMTFQHTYYLSSAPPVAQVLTIFQKVQKSRKNVNWTVLSQVYCVLSQIYAVLGVKQSSHKICRCKKGQISGMYTSVSNIKENTNAQVQKYKVPKRPNMCYIRAI